MGGPRDGTHSTYLDQRFSGLRCGGCLRLVRGADEWKHREAPMWMMGTPGSLIFIGLVAAMIAVSLMLLAWR